VDAGAADGAMPEELTPRVASAPSPLSPPSPTKPTPATPAPARGPATGFVFEAATPAALEAAMQRAIAHYRRDGGTWPRLMRHAMAEDFSWGDAARRYLALYRELLDGPAR
jgi:glycogen synthase